MSERQTRFSSSRRLVLCLCVVLLGACSGDNGRRAVYVLVDTSSTYNQQFDKVQTVMRYLLSTLQPGESLALARIDSESFNESDTVARVTFDVRPSMANSQKRAFLDSIDKFGKTIQPSRYSDITGGVLQAIEYLNETGAQKKFILVFSDLDEDLRSGQARDFPINFNGARMVAINVTELQSEKIDPRYQARIDDWQARVKQGGGSWKQIHDLSRLDAILE